MAALESLFDDAWPSGRAEQERGLAGVAPSPFKSAALPLMPLLPQPDERRPEQRPHRHLFPNELGDDWQAEHVSWRWQAERETTVYGERDVSTRQGWADKDVA